MSQSTNTSVINFCDVCNLSFEALKLDRRSRFTDMNVKNVLKNLGIK